MLEAPPKEKKGTRASLFSGKHLAIALAILILSLGAVYAAVSFELKDWNAEKVADVIGNDIHRRVHLGNVSWSLGLTGIKFKFDSVSIDEMDGSHFISAGPSKVTLALTPLLHRQFFPRDLVFERPEVWLVKLKGGKWNYSDLPNIDATKYIARMACENGKLHVIDKSGNDKKNLDGLNAENIKFSINRPLGWLAWPFMFSADVSETKYHTHITASGVGSGALGDWKKSRHSWNVSLTGFDPNELAIFGMPPHTVAAPVNLQLNGSGSLNKEIKTSLSFDNPILSAKAKEVHLTGNFLSFLPGVGENTTVNVPALAKQTDEPPVSTQAMQLDGLLAGPLKSLVAEIKIKDGEATLKKNNLSATAASGKFEVKNGSVSVSNLQANFASGTAHIGGTYSSRQSFDTTVALDSVDFNELKHVFKVTGIYQLAPRFETVSGTVKHANLIVKNDSGKTLWTLDANPSGISYSVGNEGRLISLNGGDFYLERDSFKLTDISGTLGAVTPFKLNGTGGTNSKAPIRLTADARNVDLGTARKLLAVLDVKLPASPADKMEGFCKQVDITLTGTEESPQLALKGIVKQLYVQDKNKTRTFELNDGNFEFAKDVFRLENMKGAIGQGTFTLNGQAVMSKPNNLDVAIKAKNIDLSNVKVALRDLKLETPLLAEELLAGRVNDLDGHIKGTMADPTITASLIPGDVQFEPLGTARPIHIRGGHVTYINDDLSVEDMEVSTPRGSLVVTLKMDNLSKSSVLTKFAMKSPGMDVGDLNAYLVAERTPPMVRDKYLAILHENEISEPHGKIVGHLDYVLNEKTNTPTINGQIHVSAFKAVVNGFAVQEVSGDVQAQAGNVSFSGVKGSIGRSQFALKGDVNDFADAKSRVWHLSVYARLSMQELARLAGDTNAAKDMSTPPAKFSAQISGPEGEKNVAFTAQLDKATAITFDTIIGPIAKPAGEEARIDGSLSMKTDKFTLNDTHIKFGDVPFDVSGFVDNSQVSEQKQPTISIRVHAADFVPIKTLISFAPDMASSDQFKGVSGYIRGGVRAEGALDDLKFKGGATVKELAMPRFSLSQISGSMRAADWLSLKSLGSGAAPGQIPLSFEFPTAKVEKLLVTNIKGSMTSTSQDTWEYKASANMAKGTVNLTGVLGTNSATCQAKAEKLDANTVLAGLLNAPNELTGVMKADADLGTQDLLANPIKTWSGSGSMTLNDGRVARFSLLEKRITQANLLKSGLLGFNLNNLLASVAPVEKGEYKSIVSKFHIKEGNLAVDEMKFVGDELRLRSKGNINLASNQMHLEVAGRIPRVSQQGPLGAVAPLLGVQAVTGALEDIPEMFFLGKKTQNETGAARVFAFSISAPLDKPQAATQSIYKSFHWLQGSSLASPHPLLDATSTASKPPVEHSIPSTTSMPI
ncbi:MAG TPA: AsmA-like C-terminal region-containing protein [Oculatellaceae cyanobacterium]